MHERGNHAPFLRRREAGCKRTVRQRQQKRRIGDKRLVHELVGAITTGEDVLIGRTDHVLLTCKHHQSFLKRLSHEEVRDERDTFMIDLRRQRRGKDGGWQRTRVERHVSELPVPMLCTNEQRSMWHAAKFLQVKDEVVFSAAGVFESVALAERRGDERIVRTTLDTETELCHRPPKCYP